MDRERETGISKQVKIFIGIAIFAGVALFIYEIRGVLAPFVLAFVLSYVIAPIVDRMEGRGLGRTWSILLVFILVFAGLGFGAVNTGKKLKGEMRELSSRMLRNETSMRQFSVINQSDAPLWIDELSWDNDDAATPFRLEDDLIWPLDIGIGEERVFQLIFAPDSMIVFQAVLNLHLGGRHKGKVLSVKLIGNPSIEVGRVEGVEGGQNELRAGDLIVAPALIDFGEAGPNLLTDISKKAEELQPILQPFLGEDFDLVALVKDQGSTLIDTLLGSTSIFLGGVVSGLTFVVIVPFVAFFLLNEGRHLTRSLIELVPNAYFELCLNLLHQINGQIGGYIRGQILATSVVATLAISALYVIGLQYWLPVGLLAGIANMIPFLGPLIGIITASIVAIATGGEMGVAMALVGKVIVIFLGIQLIDNIVIQPTVVAKSVEMHPLMILFVVMVGSQLMGIVGMLIAVPLTGIVKVSVQTVYEGVRGYKL